MKPDIHPDYHDVIFVDSATGNEWTSRSTMTSKEGPFGSVSPVKKSVVELLVPGLKMRYQMPVPLPLY